MQEEGHVALARLFGPGAAEYSPPQEEAESDNIQARQQITYDELCDARYPPPVSAQQHPMRHPVKYKLVLTAVSGHQVGVADGCRGSASRRCKVRPACEPACLISLVFYSS